MYRSIPDFFATLLFVMATCMTSIYASDSNSHDIVDTSLDDQTDPAEPYIDLIIGNTEW